MNIGIIGYGSFGQFLADALVKYGNIYIYSKRNIAKTLSNRRFQASMEEVANCQIVIIASGLSEMPAVCKELAKHVKTSTIVLDVCSVKIKPVEIMNKYLGGKCQLIATHPLFGPQTVSGTNLSGQKVVIYPIEVANSKQAVSFLKDILRLEVIEMTPEDHDKEMAKVHALTFFVGRGLLEMHLPNSKLGTTYYQKLLDLVEIERLHTLELFETIELGNPYAKDIRSKFINVLQGIDEKLGNRND